MSTCQYPILKESNKIQKTRPLILPNMKILTPPVIEFFEYKGYWGVKILGSLAILEFGTTKQEAITKLWQRLQDIIIFDSLASKLGLLNYKRKKILSFLQNFYRV